MAAVDAARRLYAGMAARDPRRILGALTDDFVGDVSEHMPLGVAGRHEGAEAMLREVWGPVFGVFDLVVDAERFLPSGADTVVVTGRYRGAERATGRPLDARFAHVLTVRGDRISALEQITDTRGWTG